MGSTRSAFTCLLSSTSSQRPDNVYSSVLTYEQYVRLKKRCIWKKLIRTVRAVMLDEHKDLVAGDFNGAAWRGGNRNNILVPLKEAFADCALPTPLGPTPL